mmetsp:Transcript_30066/g.80739  ORF Transcript_30066/g.80739 Transcript_30066/m.80739 type:complete len:262 (+) Transcript_30066:489-1274(+)
MLLVHAGEAQVRGWRGRGAWWARQGRRRRRRRWRRRRRRQRWRVGCSRRRGWRARRRWAGRRAVVIAVALGLPDLAAVPVPAVVTAELGAHVAPRAAHAEGMPAEIAYEARVRIVPHRPLVGRGRLRPGQARVPPGRLVAEAPVVVKVRARKALALAGTDGRRRRRWRRRRRRVNHPGLRGRRLRLQPRHGGGRGRLATLVGPHGAVPACRARLVRQGTCGTRGWERGGGGGARLPERQRPVRGGARGRAACAGGLPSWGR